MIANESYEDDIDVRQEDQRIFEEDEKDKEKRAAMRENLDQ